MKNQKVAGYVCAVLFTALGASSAAAQSNTASILFSRTYTAGDGSAYSALYRVKPSGAQRVPLTSRAVGINYRPGSWSPSGSSVVYEHLRDDRPGRSQLFVVDRQGGSPRRITTGPYIHRQPSWGPNGMIAYISDRGDHNLCLSVVHADGEGQRDLFCPDIPNRFSEPMTLSTPKWTPGGKSVVFEAAAYQPNLNESYWISYVYRVNAFTGARIQLTQQQLIDQAALEVAPDAMHGIYAFVEDNGPMVLVDFATGTQTPLYEGKLPHYSHDGRKIAYQGSNAVYVMNADGTNPQPAIAHPDPLANYRVADWSWDRTRILVTQTKTGHEPIMQIVDLATGDVSNVAAGTAADRGWYHP